MSAAPLRACVLRSGREFGPRHVQWLAKQVRGLVCFSDVPVDGVPTIPLRHDWGRWWAKIELFRPDVERDILYFDLDTVVLCDDDDLKKYEQCGTSMMLSDFYRPHLPASGLMYIRHQDKAAVWDEFTKDPAGHMERCRDGSAWGDQGFLKDVMKCERWQDHHPGKIVSYKVHCQNGPGGAEIVCFHGNPRPWDAKLTWVPKL